MPRFVRLTRDDLNRLTRGELLDRIDKEQQYWFRKQDRGPWAEADKVDFAEFNEIMKAAVDIGSALSAGLQLVRGGGGSGAGYWDEIPGKVTPIRPDARRLPKDES